MNNSRIVCHDGNDAFASSSATVPGDALPRHSVLSVAEAR
ncbi:hypothetical protein STSO111631_17035 [Stackebrandtia soli]